MAVWASAQCEVCGEAWLTAVGAQPYGELLCQLCGGPLYIVDFPGPVVDGVELPTIIEGPLAGDDLANVDGGPDDCDQCAGLGDLCLFHIGWVTGWTAHAVAALGGAP